MRFELLAVLVATLIGATMYLLGCSSSSLQVREEG